VLLPEGEPDCGPWRAVPVAEVLARLLADRPADLARPWVVAVDGRGGSGKTTLTRALAALAGPGTAVVHTDDVAWHHGFFDWDDMLAEHVLAPARAGEAVRFPPPAWRERGRPGAIEVPVPCALLFVEGCGAARRRLAPLLDAIVWVQSDLAEENRRLLERDGDTPEARAFTADWDAVEVPLLTAEAAWERAAVVVAGTPDVPPPPGHVAVGGFRAHPA
jgi:energy-coupling factor transporter ATP-binding protein EcfA2